MRFLLGMALLLSSVAPAFSNAGIFFGSGQTIQLGKSQDLQMVSEDVTITPMRGGYLFEGGSVDRLPQGDRVTYDCQFILRNLSKKLVRAQIGFPINRETPDPKKMSGWKADAGPIVREYRFMARDKTDTYHVRFVPFDRAGQLDSIFVWDMVFEPGQTRDLHVSYEIPMSFSLADTSGHGGLSQLKGQLKGQKGPATDEESKERFQTSSERIEQLRKHNHAWLSNLDFALCEWFAYVTETGKSWAGPIEHAVFRIDVKGFEAYLHHRGHLEVTLENRPIYKHSTDALCMNAVKSPVVHRAVFPAGWQEHDGTISWEYKNFVPGDLITIVYFITILPGSPEDVTALCKVLFERPPTRDDLLDLRDVLLATYGIEPRRPLMLDWAKDQVWYHPVTGRKEAGLGQEQQAILRRLDDMIAAQARMPASGK